MEIFEQITLAISNLGYPIACVIAMFYMWDVERKEHAEESRKWIEAINNNTNVMNRFLEVVKKD